ncbi:hypothetical protein TNIN_87861 [Trichonephila inaurata madagascariensis]|uniref:Uncharacterized protein n=1 Tax=Trichonephila inaurata madagascariensis TaxID=2747483 RepID=A0A8X6YJY4_9ARAC|nr:hypothetical protein TNIN_87861 [Trichonephila inaurata madagascariensis]
MPEKKRSNAEARESASINKRSSKKSVAKEEGFGVKKKAETFGKVKAFFRRRFGPSSPLMLKKKTGLQWPGPRLAPGRKVNSENGFL